VIAQRTDDPTMELMRQTAEHLGSPPALPPPLQGDTLREANEKRTAVLKEIGNILESDLRLVQASVPDAYDIPPQVPLLAARLDNNQALDQLTARVLPDGGGGRRPGRRTGVRPSWGRRPA
jgi:hypothetical protein